MKDLVLVNGQLYLTVVMMDLQVFSEEILMMLIFLIWTIHPGGYLPTLQKVVHL